LRCSSAPVSPYTLRRSIWPPINAAVALGIATIKATLVALFFMHVWHAGEKLIKVVVIAALFFLLLLLGLTMTDYATRLWS
jgi:cytochrome c oxidase subunit 4